MKHMSIAAVPAIALAVAAAGAAPAQAAKAPAPVRYASCAKLTTVYPHGVARPGGRDLVKGKVTTRSKRGYRVDARLYTLNRHLDADRDGVACER